ncbi:glycosyltransferase [Flavobacterium sp. GSP27]|uniref:glycosyltransferase n=1 Tax=unclassified Flavobacterium TaxID=196869 RepID=UPI000F81D74A|nr:MULTISPECIES: glycosyltransferase [unclassified Flavobacterium]RTY84399.1 glycosyltransferase [Flavobacterium sp. LS1P28]RTZ09444.1 glycosyltransferase [Flavobacterium sp. GSP27]
MHYNTLISIVIPCYNDSQYVEQSVLSALNQTYTNIEVIIVDDGSNIETKAVLRKIGPKVTKLITQENKGQSTARNNGIREAAGEYILVLDSDDFFEPSFAEKAFAVFLEHQNTKIVTCYANLIFEKEKSFIYKPNGGDVASFLYSNNALGSAMFKKEDWQMSGGYDENMRQGFEDWEFYIRLLQKGGLAKVVEEPLYHYRKRNNTTTQRANAVKYQLLLHLFQKHRELYKTYLDDYVTYLLFKIEKEEFEKIKNTQRLEFKIGKALLKPFRWINSIVR